MQVFTAEHELVDGVLLLLQGSPIIGDSALHDTHTPRTGQKTPASCGALLCTLRDPRFAQERGRANFLTQVETPTSKYVSVDRVNPEPGILIKGFERVYLGALGRHNLCCGLRNHANLGTSNKTILFLEQHQLHRFEQD